MNVQDKMQNLRNVIEDRISDMSLEIQELRKQKEELINAGHALYHALGYFTDDFNFMKERDYLFSAEKAAKKNWEELFNNVIPEPNYED